MTPMEMSTKLWVQLPSTSMSKKASSPLAKPEVIRTPSEIAYPQMCYETCEHCIKL